MHYCPKSKLKHSIGFKLINYLEYSFSKRFHESEDEIDDPCFVSPLNSLVERKSEQKETVEDSRKGKENAIKEYCHGL